MDYIETSDGKVLIINANPNRDADGQFTFGASSATSSPLVKAQKKYKTDLSKQTFYHGTNKENAEKITEEGFRKSTDDITSKYGQGVYLTGNETKAKYYADLEYDPTVLQLKITGTKVWDDVKQHSEGLPTISTRLQAKNPNSMWSRHEPGDLISVQDSIANGGSMAYTNEVKQLLADGYDVITFYPILSDKVYTKPQELTYTLVADPKQIKVIKPSSSVKNKHQHQFRDKIDIIRNEFDDEQNGIISSQQASLQTSIVNIQSQVVANVLNNLQKSNTGYNTNSDIMSKKEKDKFERDLILVLSAFYLIIVPTFANVTLNRRVKEFGEFATFKVNNQVKLYIKGIANNTSKSHIDTILNDLLDVIKEAFDKSIAEQLSGISSVRKVTDADLVLARKLALEGKSLSNIKNSIIKAYNDKISTIRAKAIARTETNRAFSQSQFQADIQFLKQNNLTNRAYKKWITTSDNPCPTCLDLAGRPPIPFAENFANLGDEIVTTYVDKDITKVKKNLVNFEPLVSGNAHVNCACRYMLIIE